MTSAVIFIMGMLLGAIFGFLVGTIAMLDKWWRK